MNEERNIERLIYPVIVELFRQEGWPFQAVPERNSALINFQGSKGNWPCLAQAREQVNQFVFYSVCPLQIPLERRYPVAELITMVNAKVILGNFVMDFDDGELKYKTMSCLERDTAPSVDLLKRLVYGNLAVMDQFLPGIESVVGLDTSPIEAFGQIVGPEDDGLTAEIRI